MRYRELGETGLRVSEIGLGTGRIGDPDLPDAQAEQVLRAAYDCGINFFDTAARYFASEARIGTHLAAYRDDIIIATKCGGYRTKVGGGWKEHWDYSRDGILSTIDRSR